MDLSFGHDLNPSVNKRGSRRFAESHPEAAFLHLQHLTTGRPVRLLLQIRTNANTFLRVGLSLLRCHGGEVGIVSSVRQLQASVEGI